LTELLGPGAIIVTVMHDTGMKYQRATGTPAGWPRPRLQEFKSVMSVSRQIANT
jgi:hypothetical protein